MTYLTKSQGCEVSKEGIGTDVILQLLLHCDNFSIQICDGQCYNDN